MPSLLCYRQTGPDRWEPYYCLVKPDVVFENEDSAVAMAKQHMKQAALAKEQTGNPVNVALVLRKAGYKSVDGFHIAEEDAKDVFGGDFHAQR